MQMRMLRVSLAGMIIVALMAVSAAVVSAQAEDTHTDPIGGGLVYGDPDGRFMLPLVGDWTALGTVGPYAHFSLADPPAELYVVPLSAGDMASGADAALAAVGLDSQDLSLVEQGTSGDFPGWETFVFARDDGQVVGVLQRELDDGAVALAGIGDLSALQSDKTVLTIHGFAELPVAEYLARLEPVYPTTVAAIEDLDSVEFYSGGTKLMGRLLLPEGEGPFPAIVQTHGSGMSSRGSDGAYFVPTALVDAGFAVLYYDKRGVGDSEGVFVEVGDDTGAWRLPQLADDALAGVAFLRGLQEIDPERIGLMGGSQAGWVNPLAASRSDDLAFVVSVVGPTVTVGEEVYYSDLTGGGPNLPAMTDDELQQLSDQLAAFDGDRGFDPRPSIEAMTTPGLWLWGEIDGSIPTAESRAILEEIVNEHDKDLVFLTYPDQGHHIGPDAYLEDAVEWIESQFEG
jgi:dipeptidyl aminopeptidase/acylaminoacyl peptidase